MSDDHHDHGSPGHEVDAIPAGRLINLLVFFASIAVLSCIVLIQVFNGQRDGIGAQRAKAGSYRYKRYTDEMNEVVEGAGPTADGKFFVSHGKAKELVLADPSRLRAAPPPAGWVHPDDVAAGGQGGATPPPPPAEDPEGEDGSPPTGEAAPGHEAKADDAKEDGG